MNRGSTASIISVASAAALALLALSSSSSSFGCEAKDAIAGANSNSTTSKNKEDHSSNDFPIEIYDKLQVRPPHDSTKLIKLPLGFQLPLARWSWKVHGKLLPLLHSFEPGRPDDVFVNLRVLWCKLLISLDPKSMAYEGTTTSDYATYRMLPPLSIKWAIRHLGLWRLFPRWMHANIELRIVYLQKALVKVLDNTSKTALQEVPNESNANNDIQTCVIVLGGGYDPRGAKLLSGHTTVQRVYELDLPQVIHSKRQLLLRAGFDVAANDEDIGNGNTASSNTNNGVRLEGVDLNDDDGVDRVLEKIRN